MSTLKKISLMGASTFYRLFTAFASFAIAARLLGPEKFGHLMYWTGAGVMLGLVTNFGLPIWLLKEIGGDRGVAQARLSSALTAKALLLALAVPVLAVYVGWAHRDHWIVALAMCSAMVLESAVEMLCTGFRASDRFDMEARIALIAGTSYAAASAAASLLSRDERVVALAMMAVRVAVAALTWRRVRGVVGHFGLVHAREGVATIRRTVSYAIDSVLTSSFGQVDNLFIAHVLDAALVGIYQGGMRLFMAGGQVASILANIFIPSTAARAAQGGEGAQRDVRQVQLAFLGSGLLIGLGLTVVGPTVVQLAYGPSYEPLVKLMSLFGLLFAARFAAAAWGLLLTAHGLQSFRAAASAIHWVVILGCSMPLMHRLGLAGWIWSLVIGNLFLLVVYSARCLRSGVGQSRILAAGVVVVLLTWACGYFGHFVFIEKGRFA